MSFFEPSSDIRIPLIHSHLQEVSPRDFQKSETDIKCRKCFQFKNLNEMQKLSHTKYESSTKCQAEVEPLYCKDCVSWLKICPLCADPRSENSSIAIQVQTTSSKEAQLVRIPIREIDARDNEERMRQISSWSRAQYLNCLKECVAIVCFFSVTGTVLGALITGLL